MREVIFWITLGVLMIVVPTVLWDSPLFANSQGLLVLTSCMGTLLLSIVVSSSPYR